MMRGVSTVSMAAIVLAAGAASFAGRAPAQEAVAENFDEITVTAAARRSGRKTCL